MNSERGVTLIEMLIVVTLIALMAGISYPAIGAGLDGLRMASASDSISTFLSVGLNRAERREQLIEVTVSKPDNALFLRSADGFERRLDMPAGVRIADVLPETPVDPDVPRRFLLYPGGAPPRIGVHIVSSRGAQRTVWVDPITGVPRVER
jgi:prepilin-type N-terminal cleavage/methylation domain-containing protein